VAAGLAIIKCWTGAIEKVAERTKKIQFQIALPAKLGSFPERLSGKKDFDGHPGASVGLPQSSSQMMAGLGKDGRGW
jgi:hypothetical protein